MTVRQLIKYLEACPADADVVVPGSDHSYEDYVRPHVAKAEFHPNGHISEYYERSGKVDPESEVAAVVVLY